MISPKTINITNWRKFQAKHLPNYTQENLEKNTHKLREFPSLVGFKEILRLYQDLTKVASNRNFIVQIGDCAESFADLSEDLLSGFIKMLEQMQIILASHTNKQITFIARKAGQYTKPRMEEFEERDGQTLPNYHGDMVNGFEFNEESRKQDPSRILEGYYRSAATLNYLSTHAPSLYISHEALNLYYEENMVRIEDAIAYLASAHTIWLGNKTNHPDYAHANFLKDIANPIGIKVSELITPHDLVQLVKLLNPLNIEGKITLIFRFGNNKIQELLPVYLKHLMSTNQKLLYMIDPMHGNSYFAGGYKTRKFENICAETTKFFTILQSFNLSPHGVHLEATNKDVTECLGGSKKIDENELKINYDSFCDPRLNFDQTLEFATFLGKLIG